MLAGQRKPGQPRRGSAALLLGKIVASGRVTAENLAREVGISVDRLVEYESGRKPIPLNHQARIALFAIARVPELVREGNRLRHQVAAAIAFRTNEAPARTSLR